MSNISDYLENKLLDHVFRNVSYTSPTTVYVSLHTSSPGVITDAGAGSPSNEVSGGSYARSPATFSVASGGATSNSASISYTNLPATTVTHFGVYDSATPGGSNNLLWWGPLTGSVTFLAGENAVFNASALSITLN